MGLQLPDELIEALRWVGCRWPEADESKLFDCGSYWNAFASDAVDHAEAATSAVDTMLQENSSPGLTAFEEYWKKVSGEDGYLPDCEFVASAVSIAFYSAGVLVLVLKILVIVQLIAYAIILVAAIAAAAFTLGSSLAAAAQIAVTVNRTIMIAVTTTIEAIRQLGPPLTELVREHLSKEIERLDNRPIHDSEYGVDDFIDADQRQRDADERARRKEELAYDLDKGKVTEGSRREAEVALGLEETGAVPDPVQQAERRGEDFRDGENQAWDVKGYQSREGRGGYNREKIEQEIKQELHVGENVALDTSKLNERDFADLRDLVASHPEWADRVVIY